MHTVVCEKCGLDFLGFENFSLFENLITLELSYEKEVNSGVTYFFFDSPDKLSRSKFNLYKQYVKKGIDLKFKKSMYLLKNFFDWVDFLVIIKSTKQSPGFLSLIERLEENVLNKKNLNVLLNLKKKIDTNMTVYQQQALSTFLDKSINFLLGLGCIETIEKCVLPVIASIYFDYTYVYEENKIYIEHQGKRNEIDSRELTESLISQARKR
ncbi:MAG: hypothetical protein AAF316_00085 [Cyanobacteria bacterium P01_A01_bin.80]